MESQYEDLQGAYNNNEWWIYYEIWGNMAIMFSQIILKWWQIEMRNETSENRGIYQSINLSAHF